MLQIACNCNNIYYCYLLSSIELRLSTSKHTKVLKQLHFTRRYGKMATITNNTMIICILFVTIN